MLTINTLEQMRREIIENIEQYNFDELTAAYCNYVMRRILNATRVACERKGFNHLNKSEVVRAFMLFFLNNRYAYEIVTNHKQELEKMRTFGIELTEEQIRTARTIMAINLSGSLKTLTVESILENPDLSPEMKEKFENEFNTCGEYITYNISNILDFLDGGNLLNVAAIEIMLTMYMAHERHHSVQDINFIKKSLTVTTKDIATKGIDAYNAQPHEVDANLHGLLAVLNYSIDNFSELF